MKRRSGSNEPDRAQLEQQALAELQQGAGPSARPPAATRGRARSGGAGRPQAWGASPQPSPRPEPVPEPAWRAPEPVVDDEELDAQAFDDDDGDWVDDEGEWEDDEGGTTGGPAAMGLLGVPLDYDATGIALEQLAQRSNIRQPAAWVGVEAGEAERLRDQGMAKFLERQRIMRQADTERAAERARAATPAAPAPRAPYPQLTPGLSAKHLIMQPVTAPPLNRQGVGAADGPVAADETSKPRPRASTTKAARTAGTQKQAVAETAAPAAKKAAAKKAAAKKAATKKVARKALVTRATPADPAAAAKKAPAAKAAPAEKAPAAKKAARKTPPAKKEATPEAPAETATAEAPVAPKAAAADRRVVVSTRKPVASTRRTPASTVDDPGDEVVPAKKPTSRDKTPTKEPAATKAAAGRTARAKAKAPIVSTRTRRGGGADR